jgi:hypothetical protein
MRPDKEGCNSFSAPGEGQVVEKSGKCHLLPSSATRQSVLGKALLRNEVGGGLCCPWNLVLARRLDHEPGQQQIDLSQMLQGCA